MFKFWKYRQELNATIIFQEKLTQLYELEKAINEKNSSYTFFNHREIQLYIQEKCVQEYGMLYKNLRTEIAQQIPKIRRIATEIGVQTVRYSYSTTMPEVPVGIFDSILEDLGYSPTEQLTREDTLNKMIGILQETKTCALIQMFNPLSLLKFLLGVPFLIIKQTGFNTDKIEDALIGKAVKLLFLVMLIYFLLKLGFTHEQLINTIKIVPS